MLIGTQGHLQKLRRMTLLTGSDDRSSVVTERSFFIAACKLRAIVWARVTCLAFGRALETCSLPTVSAKPTVYWPEHLFWSIRQNSQS